MEQKIIFGDREIKFFLERKNVKNLNLTVRPDMSIWVSASKEVPIDVIKDFVKRKAPWIIKNVGYFERNQSIKRNEKEYISGETFRYLGKQYRLKLIKSDEDKVKYFRGYINLYTKDIYNTNKKKELLNKWLEERANIIFHQSLDKIYEKIEKYNVPKPKIKIREMKSRWGSCYRDRNMIILNLDLIKAPKYCIDYVVLHELIHFIYENHNKDFFLLLTTLMPDWEKRKRILDEEIVREL